MYVIIAEWVINMRLKTFENQTTDLERAYYNSEKTLFKNCRFDGPADGESALKESKDIVIRDSYFNLRYPIWHNHIVKIFNSEMTLNCRAALWYSDHIDITDCNFNGVKILRECSNINVVNSQIISAEPFWKCNKIKIANSTMGGEYAFLMSKNIEISNLKFEGKYSFQYVKNMVIKDSSLNTKDAFWHIENVTVYNSTIIGQYLGWYSKNLHLVNCKIVGTQPFCYCENLVLENCEMVDADLAFEKSSVDATINGEILSVKNPKSGRIIADNIGEIILEDEFIDRTKFEITERTKKVL